MAILIQSSDHASMAFIPRLNLLLSPILSLTQEGYQNTRNALKLLKFISK